jgi:hypothetical protein
MYVASPGLTFADARAGHVLDGHIVVGDDGAACDEATSDESAGNGASGDEDGVTAADG